ncbi:hypothetical protein C9J12_18060 [Photobacterium frigidiphilum]|uniref:Rad50/SbcC-type AAA domain-containing protein n=1 Tax=Photobacterium frigidiphilum TaxID=264736 RepID=A0A2T3JCK4_9GAMM|nr:AAA family ATPase [Photobacterium frigidiphilum]PSU46615.1 hypothetical protein C9J12_18060 [Photobacterium frigidiphilum]
MKWKISKLSINNFKVFKALTLSIEGSNIVTLDGPNGFGKTSIFDALELLFTGRIRRVLDTYDKVEGSKTSKPKDHLLWNKHHAGDLSIKVELENIESNEKIYFCRFAKSSDLKNKDNCKPNLESFKIFKLCWLRSLDDDEFTDIFQDKDLETFLDVNHMENYGVLNYLEQGSNHFLYENNTKTRKEKLSHLFNVDYTKTNISNITGMISLINSSYLKKEKRDFIASLSEEIKALKSKNVTSEDGNDNLVYNRISDLKSIPLWDSKLPVVSDNTKDFNEMIILIKKLIVMSENKDEIKKGKVTKK